MLDPKMETLLKVAELRSYTKAAQALHLTQPAVTRQLQRLEEHYGVKLVDSSGHAVRLTEAGRSVIETLRAQLANEQALLRRLEGMTERLRIGATLSIADYYLPAQLAQSALLPARFSLTVGNTKRLTEWLMDGALDCAFVEGDFDKRLFHAQLFQTAAFVPVASSAHPLAKKRVKLSDLTAYPLLLREQGSGTREILVKALDQRGDAVTDFADVVEIGSFLAIKQLLCHMDAISFMYEGVARAEIEAKQLCRLRVSDLKIAHPLWFVRLKHHIDAARCDAFFASVHPSDD